MMLVQKPGMLASVQDLGRHGHRQLGICPGGADAYGPALAGFLLTGANEDGAEGLLRIHMDGGITAVQDPEEAQIPTMPRAAIARHSPDHVLALRELRTLLLQLESAHAH